MNGQPVVQTVGGIGDAIQRVGGQARRSADMTKEIAREAGFSTLLPPSE